MPTGARDVEGLIVVNGQGNYLDCHHHWRSHPDAAEAFVFSVRSMWRYVGREAEFLKNAVTFIPARWDSQQNTTKLLDEPVHPSELKNWLVRNHWGIRPSLDSLA